MRYLLLLACAAAACSSRTDARPDSSASTPAYLSEECGLVRVQTHPDPDSLIAEYLRRDATRAEADVDDWSKGAVACPGEEGGPDMFSLAADYRTRGVQRSDSVVAVEVTTRRLGSVGFDSAGRAFMKVDTSTMRDTVRAIRTPFGWRIDDMALRLNVRPDAPLSRKHLSASDMERLRPYLAPVP